MKLDFSFTSQYHDFSFFIRENYFCLSNIGLHKEL